MKKNDAATPRDALPDLQGGWTVVCDFDGTISAYDVTDAILSRFAGSRWEAVEKAWVRGEITARECMARQVEMIGASGGELDEFLDGVPVDAAFGAFASLCRRRNLPLIIVSDGLDYAIRRILAQHGLAGIQVIANRLVFLGKERWRLDFPHGRPECGSGVCKCRVSGAPESKVLLIGDGRSDFCLAGQADFVLAKEGLSLLRHCREQGLPCLPFRDFRDICALFEAREAGRPASAPAGRAARERHGASSSKPGAPEQPHCEGR